MTTAKSEAPPAAAEDPVAAKAKAEADAAAKEAREAATKLKLVKVTSTRKERFDPPHAAWSVVEGANHFEGEIPEEVGKAYAKLIADEVIKVEWLDGAGKAHPWTPPKIPLDDGKQH